MICKPSKTDKTPPKLLSVAIQDPSSVVHSTEWYTNHLLLKKIYPIKTTFQVKSGGSKNLSHGIHLMLLRCQKYKIKTEEFNTKDAQIVCTSITSNMGDK